MVTGVHKLVENNCPICNFNHLFITLRNIKLENIIMLLCFHYSFVCSYIQNLYYKADLSFYATKLAIRDELYKKGN